MTTENCTYMIYKVLVSCRRTSQRMASAIQESSCWPWTSWTTALENKLLTPQVAPMQVRESVCKRLEIYPFSLLTHCWFIPLCAFSRALAYMYTPCRLFLPFPSSAPCPHLKPLLDQKSSSFTALLCTATPSSHPLPAARLLIAVGREEWVAVRHGRPLEPTESGQGQSHHSCATAAHSKQGK